MRPMILTSPGGEKRRLSPFGIIGWKAGDVPAGTPGEPSKVYLGTIITTAAGHVGVLESEEEVDRIFWDATSAPSRYTTEKYAAPGLTVDQALKPPGRKT